jgi:hypothetical protein
MWRSFAEEGRGETFLKKGSPLALPFQKLLFLNSVNLFHVRLKSFR